MDNKGLVNHAEKALSEEWGYVWGTFGQILTEKILMQKAKQYPESVGKYVDYIKGNWLGRPTADCAGLIKSYYWGGKYKASTDVSADTMYSEARERGVISTIPELCGVCVWKPGHIGIYVGNGNVIEAHGTKYGVIKTPLAGTGATMWTHWFKCQFIEYIDQPKKDAPKYPGYALKFNLFKKDNNVVILKERLIKLGYLKSIINSIFGIRTLIAVRSFQKVRGLKMDGIVEIKTWEELFK